MWKKKALVLAAVLVACGAAVVFAKTQEKVVKKEVDFDRQTFAVLPTKLMKETGTLLLSDSPEYVGKEVGVLAAGTLQGDSRVYFYHVNEEKEDRKIVILARNMTNRAAKVQVKREIYAKPNVEYFEVGRELSKKELAPLPKKLGKEITIEPGMQIQLFTDLENVKVRQDQLFSGILDFHSSGELYVKVLMIPFSYGALGAGYTMKTLPIDEVELRGTYAGANRDVDVVPTYDVSLGGAYVELATDREDAYVRGIDELSNGKAVIDKGNYGVAYKIHLRTQGEGKFDLFFNPQGGAYAGSIAVASKKVEQVVDVPEAQRPYIGHRTIYDTFYIGTYEGGENLQIRFMPAGASNLPVKLLLVPTVDGKNVTEDRVDTMDKRQ